jgi:hypothetical protein
MHLPPWFFDSMPSAPSGSAGRRPWSGRGWFGGMHRWENSYAGCRTFSTTSRSYAGSATDRRAVASRTSNRLRS